MSYAFMDWNVKGRGHAKTNLRGNSMSYVKMAKELKEAASADNRNKGIRAVERKVNEFVNNPNMKMQDLALAMGYAIHYTDYEEALPAQENLMLAYAKLHSTPQPNPTSSFIAGAALSENLKHIRDAMKDHMQLDGTPALQKGIMIACAVYEAPTEKSQSAILTVAEALSRDWDKESVLDR